MELGVSEELPRLKPGATNTTMLIKTTQDNITTPEHIQNDLLKKRITILQF